MPSQPVIIFPSVNRPEMLHESVLSAIEQSIPCRVIVSVPGEEHVSRETLALPGVELAIGGPGLCAQRNAALRKVASRAGVVFFFDDDVEIERHYVANMLEMFARHPEVVLASGVNVGLGAPAGTLTRETAKALINRHAATAPASQIKPMRAVIGCMMAFQARLIGSVAFDERLPLYGYMEDYDFSLQCKQHGELVEVENCLLVHIETSQGRMGSRRRGYSEIVNPIYIWKKKTGADFVRTMLGSLRRTVRSARRVGDVSGRQQFLGNLMGWKAVLTGEINPEKILYL